MIQKIAKEFNIKEVYVHNLINLFEDDNTVPFIARYRKEVTGNMDEIIIRNILERYDYLSNLEKRKSEILKSIEEKGKLTEELKKSIVDAETLKTIEDIYLPYKSKRKTKGDIAKENGLEPLANYILTYDDGFENEAENFINNKIIDIETAISGAMDIIIENIGHNLDIKNEIRNIYQNTSKIVSSKRKDVEIRTEFEDYYEFMQNVRDIPSHRIFAIFRGEKEKVLKVTFEINEDLIFHAMKKILKNKKISLNEITIKCIKNAYKRIIQPSIELEIRHELKEKADEKAIIVFNENLKNLLMTPPVKNKRLMGIDPAFRTGCKFALLDETGKLLDFGIIYPTEPQKDYEKSANIIENKIKEYRIDSIIIGNGTASRETEEFINTVIAERKLNVDYTIVSEAGASVYSASEIAAKEFPDIDVTIRGAISIARRVLDPLAEYVKIDPKSIGVGMYQHDVNQKRLKVTLRQTVEYVVNSVGVDLNTASVSLLQYVSGLSENLSEKIVEYRNKTGKFKSRFELLNVSGLGEKIFTQCAGFLKIYNGEEPLDELFIHPENYESVYNLLEELNLPFEKKSMIKLILKNRDKKELSEKCGMGLYTLEDIILNFEKPKLDIRESLDCVVFKKGITNLDDLQEGMILDGKITNIVDFGAFVDIGLKNDGMIHISQMADKFIKHPSEEVYIGQNVKVKIIGIDKPRNRVNLSMKIN
jgi:uncharacterized protein